MIQLVDARIPPHPEHWQQNGGFCWWYAEAGDASGNGIVLIWAFGLPFLPGHASRLRKGEEVLPQDRPSLNVVVYAEGKPVFYVLRECERASWDGGGVWQFDDTRIESHVEAGKLALRVSLDVAVAGEEESLTGSLIMAGRAARTVGKDLGFGPSVHQWTPLVGPSFASAAVRCGDFRWRVTGRGYHDRNASAKPLHSLGIRTWVWARAALPDRDRIVYALWPEAGTAVEVRGLDVFADGRAEPVDGLRLRTDGAGRTAFGMPAWRSLQITLAEKAWLNLHLDRRVDDGPFYLRFLPTATSDDGPVEAASAEVIVPARVDLARHRPFVRMRVSGPGNHASVWLPLFEGPRATRLQRLLGRTRPTTQT